LMLYVYEWLPKYKQSIAERRTAVAARKVAAAAAAENVQRQAVLGRRFAPVVTECSTGWLSQSSKCGELAGLSDDERAQCQKVCTQAGAGGYAAALRGARSTCAFASTPPRCEVKKPAPAVVADSQVKTDLSTCAVQCRDDRRTAAQATASARAAEAARRAHQGGQGLWCIYLDRSRSCSCAPHSKGSCLTDETSISSGYGSAWLALAGPCSPCVDY